jgi:hypothetical protein
MPQETKNPKVEYINEIGKNKYEQNNFCAAVILVRAQERPNQKIGECCVAKNIHKVSLIQLLLER